MRKVILAIAVVSIVIMQIFVLGLAVGNAGPVLVQIDTKPGSDLNSINPKSKGTIPVAILSSLSFDAFSVDVGSVRFGPTGTEASAIKYSGEDVNGDGLVDLVLHFRTRDCKFTVGDTQAKLTGMMGGSIAPTKSAHFAMTEMDGVPIEGTDTISVVNANFMKIAIVTDIGGRGDISFNDMAFKGGDEAARDFGLQLVELISNSDVDYVPNLETAAKDKDVILTFAVGFALTDAVKDVAGRYPDKDFVLIDGYAPGMPNVMCILFEEHKGSAIVGAIAGLAAAHYGYPHVGAVLGMEIAPLLKFEIGYKWGVNWAMDWYQNRFGETPPIIGEIPVTERVLWEYTGTFSEISKGYEAAKWMYADGAVAVYNIAGPLGFGINEAVKDRVTDPEQTMGPPFWIRVDSDQDWINPGFVLVSMMKRVDRAVYFGTQLELGGTFRQVIAENNGSLP